MKTVKLVRNEPCSLVFYLMNTKIRLDAKEICSGYLVPLRKLLLLLLFGFYSNYHITYFFKKDFIVTITKLRKKIEILLRN